MWYTEKRMPRAGLASGYAGASFCVGPGSAEFVYLTKNPMGMAGSQKRKGREGKYMWAFERVFYQVYPLGFVGASYENDGSAPGEGKGIGRLAQWIGHLRDLGVGAVYFSPIFYSDSHGYNTRDFGLVDNRLGSNGEFAALVAKLHEADIKVVLDGVFNHVGRGFGPFLDVLRNRENSPYLDWFYRIDLGGGSPPMGMGFGMRAGRGITIWSN